MPIYNDLEPRAIEHDDHLNVEALSFYSQAISLKRIADSLDRLASADKQATLTAQNLVEQLRLNAEAQARERTAAVEAAKTDDNPWIEWPGGECPVPDGTLVDVRWRNGIVHVNERASRSDNNRGNAVGAFWQKDGWDADIVAYRISK